MIESISIKNFRCLKDVELTLTPLTVLLGPNASGKSSILSVLDPTRTVAPTDFWPGADHVEVGVRYADGRTGLTQARAGGGVPLGMGHVYQLLRLDIRALRRDNDVARESLLETTGGNLANVFATLDRGRQASLAKSFVQLVPVYGDVDVQPLPGAKGRHGLYFQDRWAPGVWYTSECVSDGSVLLLALLAVQYQTPPVELLAIEEPERGLHPYLFESVVKALRSISEPSSDRAATQVVLATHSPEILDYVLPHEVRFLDRDAADGSVRIDQPPSTSPDWEAKFDEYRRSLGEMWLAGAVGGVPGSP